MANSVVLFQAAVWIFEKDNVVCYQLWYLKKTFIYKQEGISVSLCFII